MRFKCPHCNENSNLNDIDIKRGSVLLDIKNAGGYRNCNVVFYICQNPDCNKHTIDLHLDILKNEFGVLTKIGTELEIRIKPDEDMNIIEFPEYIPSPILSDYKEACMIKNLSPKASATLSRRCLQGIIRDFWGVKGKSLYHEINSISDKIDSLTREALDAVRSIGNIGAHMETDINTIIDVDDEEALLLIQLIETLIVEWYIARYDKEQRMKRLINAKEKKYALKMTNSEG